MGPGSKQFYIPFKQLPLQPNLRSNGWMEGHELYLFFCEVILDDNHRNKLKLIKLNISLSTTTCTPCHISYLPQIFNILCWFVIKYTVFG